MIYINENSWSELITYKWSGLKKSSSRQWRRDSVVHENQAKIGHSDYNTRDDPDENHMIHIKLGKPQVAKD